VIEKMNIVTQEVRLGKEETRTEDPMDKKDDIPPGKNKIEDQVPVAKKDPMKKKDDTAPPKVYIILGKRNTEDM